MSKRAAYDKQLGMGAAQQQTRNEAPKAKKPVECSAFHFDKKSAYYDQLPESLQIKLLKRQTETLQQVRLSTDSLTSSYGLLGLYIAWMLLLCSSFFSKAQWESTSSFAVISFAVGVAACISLPTILNHRYAVLKGFVYFTPLYVIRTKNDKVEYWPIWKILDLQITHHSINGSYRVTELSCEMGEGKANYITVSFKNKNDAGYASNMLDQFKRQLHAAHTLQDQTYFTKHDDLKGVEFPDLIRVKKYRLQVLFGAVLPLLFSLYVCGAATNYNATLPKRLVIPQPLAPQAYFHQNTGTPQSITVNNNDNRNSIPGDQGNYHFNLEAPYLQTNSPVIKLVPLPAIRFIFRHSKEALIASFKVITQLGSHYLIGLQDWTTGRRIMDIFVQDGKQVNTKVPLGRYRMKYTLGTVWYGSKLLFGSETHYAEASKERDFYRNGNVLEGNRVELIKQLNGNLDTYSIPPEKW